jgi:hypothetical protein
MTSRTGVNCTGLAGRPAFESPLLLAEHAAAGIAFRAWSGQCRGQPDTGDHQYLLDALQ